MSRSNKLALKYMLFVWLFTTSLAFLVNCAGKDGKNGADGAPGVNGSPGRDGTSPEPSAYDIAEIIDPCGKQAAHDEVILRLTNGSLLAHYSDGQKQFFAVIGAGTYQSTDGTRCVFSVDANNVVRW